MDGRKGRRKNDVPPAPGSRPSWKIFLPYVLLALVLLIAGIWIYFLGPRGEPREPIGETLRQPTASMQLDRHPSKVAA